MHKVNVQLMPVPYAFEIVNGNIIPYEVLSTMLFHPLTRLLFRENLDLFLPIGLVNAFNNREEAKYALLFDTADKERNMYQFDGKGIPIVCMKLHRRTSDVNDGFSTLLPATQFVNDLPVPYQLKSVLDRQGPSEKQIWKMLEHMIDYIDCITFNLSS